MFTYNHHIPQRSLGHLSPVDALKSWRELLRDRLFFTLAFVLPAALMLTFAYGLILDVERIPFAVVDHDKSAMSRDYLHHYIDSRYFDYQGDLV